MKLWHHLELYFELAKKQTKKPLAGAVHFKGTVPRCFLKCKVSKVSKL